MINLPVGTFPQPIGAALAAAVKNTEVDKELSAICGSPVNITAAGDSGGWRIEVLTADSKQWVALGYMKQLTGCCGVVVSTNARTFGWCGKGVGTIMNKFRQELAYQLGYTTMLCTDVTANKAQQRVLEKTGWKRIFEFVNRRTANPVSIHVVDLREGRE